MRTHIFQNVLRAVLSFVVVLASTSSAFAGATIIIINANAPGVGFNDPTPAPPVGGNTGTTLGEQRLIAFQYAADIWGATLDSNQVIRVRATFEPLAPNVLGSAGATEVFSDFPATGLYPGPEFPDTWYGAALADKRAGAEVNPVPDAADIRARFSSTFNFYLGLDNNHGPLNDFVAVLLHELAHGLNFQTFVDEETGENLGDTPETAQTDIYARHMLDTSSNLYWDQMTAAQRKASVLRFGRLVWDGSNVNSAVPSVLSFGSPEVRVLTPGAVAGLYQFGTAAFGTPITLLPALISSSVVAAVDASNTSGPATTDGCTSFTNAADVAGKIALIERGTCGFVVKAKNAQLAGAVAAIIYNNAANAAAGPPGMAGVDSTVTIPSVSLSRTDGLALVASLPAVTASIGPNAAVRAGADELGSARLFAPNPVQPGSSGSHYDSIAFRNLLMEPAINPDLTHNVKAPDDLTLELLRDIGWFADADLDGVADAADCDATSDRRSTLFIDGSNTGVANVMLSNGCTISDLIQKIGAVASNHGDFVSDVSHLTNQLKEDGTITNGEKGLIQSRVAGAKIP